MNGEAIYGTRPWSRAEDKTVEGLEVRYTQKNEFLYAILLGKPQNPEVIIKYLKLCPYADVDMLGFKDKLQWEQIEKDVKINLPLNLKDSPAYCFRINPKLRN